MRDEALAALVAEAVASAVNPLLKRIADLEAANASALEADLEAVVAERVAAAVAAIPAPADGKSLEPADVEPMLERMVAEAVAALPDPVSVAGALIDRTGSLVLTLSNGATRDLGTVVGADVDMSEVERQIRAAVDAIPRPRDAFALESFDVVALDERRIQMRFQAGETLHTYDLTFPVPIYRGVWKADEEYERGDLTTHAGSLWHCEDPEAKAKPGTGDAWRLAAKRGRDGKDLVPSSKTATAVRDLTHEARA